MIKISVTKKAEAKYNCCDPRARSEIATHVNELIVTMPTAVSEPPERRTCQSSEQPTKDTSKDGSTRTSPPHSILRPLLAAFLALNSLSGFCQSTSASSPVNDQLISALSIVESNGRTTATGDNGRAAGAFQFWRGTWNHVSQIRRKAGLQTAPYEEGSRSIPWSRAYARSYLLWIEAYLTNRGVSTVSRGHLYAAYNLGPAGFRRRGFDLKRVPAVTRRAIEKLERIYNGN